MSDKPVVRDYDHQVAPGVAAHTHEETKTGKNTYEHKAETGFEGQNVTGSAYEKTKITMADDSKNKQHGSEHHHRDAAASSTGVVAQHSSTAVDSHRHHDSSVAGSGSDGSNKPIVRDYDYQVAPGVAAHTHEELKTGKNSYEHKAETGFEGPNVVGSAYEKTKVTMAEDKSATSGSASSGHHHHSHHAGESHAGTAASSTTTTATSTELDKQKHSSSAVAASIKPIERDYDYQPAPGVQAHTHEVIKQGTNTYEHKAETTFEGPNTVGSAYEKTTVKMSGPKQT